MKPIPYTPPPIVGLEVKELEGEAAMIAWDLASRIAEAALLDWAMDMPRWTLQPMERT